jgi:hypothetical protein
MHQFDASDAAARASVLLAYVSVRLVIDPITYVAFSVQ